MVRVRNWSSLVTWSQETFTKKAPDDGIEATVRVQEATDTPDASVSFSDAPGLPPVVSSQDEGRSHHSDSTRDVEENASRAVQAEEELLAAVVVVRPQEVVPMESHQENQGDSSNKLGFTLCGSPWRWLLVAIGLLCISAVVVGVTMGLVHKNTSATPASNTEQPPETVHSEESAIYFKEIRTLLVPYHLWTEANAPQLLATEFMAYSDQTRIAIDDPRLYQRFALMTMYFANGGERWPLSPADHECDWTFIVCSDESEATQLVMNVPISMTGSLPAEIGLLTHLEILNLQQNRLEGALPDSLYELTNLVELHLSMNRFSSTINDKVGQLAKLQSLYLHDNFFEGTLPEHLSELSYLKHFVVYKNQFEGPIMHHLPFWTGLVDFSIGDTFLEGTIPPEVGLLTTNLRQLMALRTRVSGTLPTELGQLTMLQELFISDTSLEGTIPTELGKLELLVWFSIAQNFLTSTIPTELANLSKVQHFALAQNYLTGTIPTVLGLLPKVWELYFNHNNLSGTIPTELAQLTTLQRLEIQRSGLTGTVPSEICDLRLGELNQFVSTCYIHNCSFPDCCTFCLSPKIVL